MKIKDLQLRAKVVVEGFFSGLHRSPYHGFSVEFSEYREYSPGDDTRYLDWRLFARSDRYYIKRFEDETNLRCHLVLDMSRSMDYGSRSQGNRGLYLRSRHERPAENRYQPICKNQQQPLFGAHAGVTGNSRRSRFTFSCGMPHRS